MRIYGYFTSVKGDTYKVTITTSGTGTDMEICDGGVLEFASEDAAVISSGVDDSLDVAQQHGLRLKLHSRRLVEELFTSEYKDAGVDVSLVGGYGTGSETLDCVFSGWLEPRTLSQPFNEVYDDLSLDCVDCLSAMQYSPFRGVGVTTTYEAARSASGMSTFASLLAECLTAGCGSMDGYAVWYDGSKTMADGTGVFASLSVSDLIYLGDDEDDTKTCLEVVESLLRYLNLHIVQYGKNFYIYSWESVRKGAAASAMQRLALQGSSDTATSGSTASGAVAVTVLTAGNVEDTDAEIDVSEIFNQVALTVNTKSDESALVSPLDSDSKLSIMGPRRPYVTEYAADGEGVRAGRCFWSLVTSGVDLNNYDGERTYKDYYVRVWKSKYWKIGSKGEDWAQAQADSDASRPDRAIHRLGNEIGALLLSVGTVDHKPGKGDNSPQATISMTDMLVIGVNGSGDDSKPTPSDTALRNAAPVAEYTGGGSSATYSPAEAGKTNYLVIEGSIILNPIMTRSHELHTVRSYSDADSFANANKGTAPSRTNGDGRYLAFGWWFPSTSTTAGTLHTFGGTSYIIGDEVLGGWIPYTGDGPEQYEYKSASGDDTISKVGILECMLTIGDKVLVEDKGTESDGTVDGGDGSLSRLSWQAYKTLDDCGGDLDTYYAQSFTIGIDPKKGDKLIGTEHDIATNFDYTTDISADKGMAIPLPHSEHLHGEICLKILGPVNEMWDDNVRRHKTWFRGEKWSTNSIRLMSHVSSIIVKSLSIKMYTPTASAETDDEADLVYLSQTSHEFLNKKDGLETDIHSGFTEEEIATYGLTDAILRGTVCDSEGSPVLTIKDTNSGETGKPEKLYVDAVYNELHLPRVILEQNMQDKGCSVQAFGLFRHEALGRDFYVRDMGRNLMEGSAQLQLEERF